MMFEHEALCLLRQLSDRCRFSGIFWNQVIYFNNSLFIFLYVFYLIKRNNSSTAENLIVTYMNYVKVDFILS